MKNIVAIIPARGGSKRLPGKNIYPICGRPMIEYAINACNCSKYDIEVWVSTDCEKIKKVVSEAGTFVHDRSEANSKDSAFKQAAIREAAKYIVESKSGTMPDIFLSVQANSPTISSKEIDKCIDALIEYNRDEIISVDKNLMQDASIRVFKSSYVFQRDLSTNCGVVITDLYDVHNCDDVLIVENILSKRIV